MSKKVLQNSAYYIIASLLPTAVSFFMLPIYTRYLTPADYGVVALVISLQAFLPLIMTLQFDKSISRFYFDYYKNKEKLKVFISTILVVILVFSIVVLAGLLFYIDEILSFIFPKTIGYNEIFILGIIASFFGVLNSTFISLIKVQQNAKLFMKVSLYLFLLSLIINVVEVIVLERGVYGVIEASLISIVISFIVYLYLVREFFVFKFDFNLIWSPLKFSLPLIPHSLSGLIFMYSDRIILERSVTLSAIGLYMFADKIAMVFKMMVNEFHTALSPYFYQKSKESIELAKLEMQSLSLIVLYWLAMLISLVGLFSVEVVYFIFDERYYDVWAMIPLLSSAYLFRFLYSIAASGLSYEKRTDMLAIITIVAASVNIILNLWLIPIYGIMVAIYTTIFSFLLTFIFAQIVSKRIYNMNLNIKKIMYILIYVYGVITFSIFLNKSFADFGYIEYIYKILILLCGIGIGYKMKLINITKLKNLKGGVF